MSLNYRYFNVLFYRDEFRMCSTLRAVQDIVHNYVLINGSCAVDYACRYPFESVEAFYYTLFRRMTGSFGRRSCQSEAVTTKDRNAAYVRIAGLKLAIPASGRPATLKMARQSGSVLRG